MADEFDTAFTFLVMNVGPVIDAADNINLVVLMFGNLKCEEQDLEKQKAANELFAGERASSAALRNLRRQYEAGFL